MTEMQEVTFSIFDYKNDVIDLGSLGKVRIRRPVVNPGRLRRRLLHATAHAYQDLLTRTTVRGLENIPREGPVLVLPNHVSNLDGPLVLANYPRQVEMVGPGDFKMLNLKDFMLRAYGMTMIKRGFADTDGLKALIAHLRAGRDLLMFPGGGMWEKRRFEVKPGAAYLSQVTGARILPVAIGGTYLKSKSVFAPFTVTFGKVLPAVPRASNRDERDQVQADASRRIEQAIWSLMEPADRAMYERWACERYEMRLAFAAVDGGAPLAYDGPPLPEMSVLAEFVAKPNLFRPMWENARLPVEPFREARFFAPIEVQMAVRALHRTLSAGSFERYVSYRMGDEADARLMAALEALSAVIEWAIAHGALIKMTPLCFDPEAEA